MVDSAPVPGTQTPTVDQTGLRRTALFDTHRAMGAKLVEFGGWEMPLSYPLGTLAEHRSCRHDSVVFDVSHLGTVRLSGAGAFDRLQQALSNDLRKIRPGRAQYTHLLDDSDGSVVDDIIVLWLSDDQFDVMPNASNTERVLEAVGGTDTTDGRCILAVQGPHARTRVAPVVPAAATVGRFDVEPFVWEGVPGVVSGTGYTGEDGFELAVPVDAAPALWKAIVDTGVPPAGLGARDTLRLEGALPLHGHELGPGISPLQAGLDWVVGWDKDRFRGRSPLDEERQNGPVRRLVGLAAPGRQPLRQHAGVSVAGRVVGTVTSGNYSPMLEHAIALALIDAAVDPRPGTPVEVDQRGRVVPATVVATPFVRPGQWASER